MGTGDVDVLVCHRVVDRGTNATLSREVNDGIVRIFYAAERLRVANVRLDEAKVRIWQSAGKVGEFEIAGIQGVEIIDDGDERSFADKGVHDVTADKTGAAGYQAMHYL